MGTDPYGPLRRAASAAALLLLAQGCFAPRGYLFTRTTEPYYLPHDAPVARGAKRCSIDITQVKEPFSRANISVIWTNREVEEAARRAGLSELRYADLHTLSFVNGVYMRRRLVFYGE